ncbi:MAG TPA: response regulator [Deltaproteobacteria bacterium]|nr:response regulator [Deltaproteobacteria bacterium]HPJ93633.1 response regulator [Deltaproteobacteria bacterium]HPR51006.1 response regulator [Deltaproteobacteria bacterium]
MMQDKVLIVDDDPGIRSTISELIEELGYLCETASDGLDAVELLDSGPYLCVFTDIMMPNMSGLELIKKIKARDVSLPIIVITGYASLEIAIDAMKYGASDFISKPFKVKQIELMLNKVKREKDLVEENKRFSDTLQLHRLIDNLVGQIEDKNEELISLQAISEKIISMKGIRDLVGAIIDVSKQLLDEADVRFFPISRKHNTLIDPDGGKEILLEPGLLKGNIIRKNGSGKALTDKFETIFPLMIEGQVFGALDILTSSILGDDKESKILYLLDRSAERMENVALYEGLYENMLSTLNSMAKILDARDPHTSQHSTRVTSLSMAMGKALGLDEDDLDVLYIAASLHDIGKVGIPDHILLKPDGLTNEEFAVIKKHPDIGADILKPIPPMAKETEIIRHHHERYDGRGYPAGLKGKEIPYLSRIISLADSFDAMTSDRPYRDGMSIEKAVEEIERCKGSQFDPELAEIFIHHVALS